jgi:hypothetical protein
MHNIFDLLIFGKRDRIFTARWIRINDATLPHGSESLSLFFPVLEERRAISPQDV